jgi:hypothetical protein
MHERKVVQSFCKSLIVSSILQILQISLSHNLFWIFTSMKNKELNPLYRNININFFITIKEMETI